MELSCWQCKRCSTLTVQFWVLQVLLMSRKSGSRFFGGKLSQRASVCWLWQHWSCAKRWCVPAWEASTGWESVAGGRDGAVLGVGRMAWEADWTQEGDWTDLGKLCWILNQPDRPYTGHPDLCLQNCGHRFKLPCRGGWHTTWDKGTGVLLLCPSPILTCSGYSPGLLSCLFQSRLGLCPNYINFMPF